MQDKNNFGYYSCPVLLLNKEEVGILLL